jgi:hypothetical protein
MEPQKPTNELPPNQPGIPTIDPTTGAVTSQPITTGNPVAPTPQTVLPSQPLQPLEPPFGSGQPSGGVFAQPVSAGKPKKRWVLPVIGVAALLVLIGGGYVFGLYLPNRPDAIYATGLKRSGTAVDSLVSYASAAATKSYKSYDVNGKLVVKGDVSMDAKLTGSFDEKANGTLTVNADILGEKITADVRSLHVDDNASPDVYVRVGGIKSALDTYGLTYLDSLDNQWLAIDHTLIDSMASSLEMSDATKTPTNAQVSDAVVKAQTVNKKYLFTDDAKTAVLKDPKYIGKETKDGRPTYHYQVGYDKAHLQAYIKAMKTALDSSSLNSWSKSANDGKNLSELVDFDSLQDTISKAKANYTFDLWIDSETKVIHALHFTDPSDKTSSFTIAQNYTGGDTYPFALTISGKDDLTGDTVNASVKLALNTATNKESGELTFKEGGTNGSFNFDITPSSKELKIVAPTGAQSVMSVLDLLGLNSLTSDSTATSDLTSLSDLSAL